MSPVTCAVNGVSFLNQDYVHLLAQVVFKTHAGDLGLFDRGATRRRTLWRAAIVNQLPTHSVGNIQQQTKRKTQASCLRTARRMRAFQKEDQCQES